MAQSSAARIHRRSAGHPHWVELLAIAAAFSIFDGTQAVGTGVLRGVGNTRSA
jgi:hypothetical protein